MEFRFLQEEIFLLDVPSARDSSVSVSTFITFFIRSITSSALSSIRGTPVSDRAEAPSGWEGIWSFGCIFTISGVDGRHNADHAICMMQINTDDGATEALPPTGPDLHRQVRAAFVMKGISFNLWCKEKGIIRRTAEQALLGINNSRNARSLVQRIVIECGIYWSNEL